MVTPRYTATAVNTAKLPEATASPPPITLDPTYNGCANQRYGPDAVTSRDLFRCPAAQMRRSSPGSAISAPATSVAPVGCASQITTMANRNPSGTRARASRFVRSATCLLRGSQPPLDCREHFSDLDIQQAHAIEATLTEVMASAHRGPRHGLVARPERPIALGPRRTV